MSLVLKRFGQDVDISNPQHPVELHFLVFVDSTTGEEKRVPVGKETVAALIPLVFQKPAATPSHSVEEVDEEPPQLPMDDEEPDTLEETETDEGSEDEEESLELQFGTQFGGTDDGQETPIPEALQERMTARPSMPPPVQAPAQTRRRLVARPQQPTFVAPQPRQTGQQYQVIDDGVPAL